MTQVKCIAHFIETDIPGGAEQVLLDLCLYLKTQTTSLRPIVLTFGHPWTIAQCAKLGIEHKTIPFRGLFKKTIFLPMFAIVFAFWLRLNKINLLHSHLFGPITGGSLATFIAGIPHVGTLHDIYMIEEKPKRISLIKLASRLGTKFITVSKNMQAFYERNSGLNVFQTIYNGINTEKYKPKKHTAELPIKIVCIGRLIALKQVDHVVLACLALSEKYQIELTVIGDGPELTKLKSIANKSPAVVTFAGQKDNIVDYLKQADIFVQFSTSEGLSRSISEAASCGLACVVSDVGGNSEIIQDQYSGILVPYNDQQALYQALENIISNEDLREQFSNHSRQHAVNTFNDTICHEKNVSLYSTLLN